MELVYTLVGAVVGGGIAAAVAWLQTRATLRHEVDMLHQQLQAAQAESRESLRRMAAVDASAALVPRWAPRITPPHVRLS